MGVTYNGARIQLSERARELANLRILGFSRGEVSFILVGGVMVLALLAQPAGWLAGLGIVWAFTHGMESDLLPGALHHRPLVPCAGKPDRPSHRARHRGTAR